MQRTSFILIANTLRRTSFMTDWAKPADSDAHHDCASSTGFSTWFSVVLLVSYFAVAAHSATFTTINFPGSVYTTAGRINDLGQIVGSYIDSGGRAHGFLRNANGTFISFDGPRGTAPNPSSINIAGQIVGSYNDNDAAGNSHSHGFVREPNGAVTSFNADRNALDTVILRNTDSGQFLGQWCSADFCHGFLRSSAGAITTFDPPGSLGTSPADLNLFGEVVGSYSAPDGSHGFIRHTNGTFIIFDPPNVAPPPDTATVTQAINLIGSITGYYQDTNFIAHGFLRKIDGTFISFDPSGSTFTNPISINLFGIIAGSYDSGLFGPTCPGYTLPRTHGFIRALNGVFTSLDPPGNIPGLLATESTAINALGAVTGSYNVFQGCDKDGNPMTVSHGYLRTP